MDIKTGGKGVTFAVHDVEAVRSPLQTWKTEHGINVLLKSADSGEIITIESCSEYNSNSVSGVTCNPLLAAVHIAFSEHRPLTLSPDIIWIAILHGVAQHVNNNAEELRHLLVSHKGKLAIAIQRDDILIGTPENAWDSVIHQFSQAVHSHVGQQYGKLISDFSTTGDLERTACEVALLDMYQPYFKYEMYCICGIPEITLEGETNDWLKLRQKIELLQPYKLDWWLPHLRDIAEHLHRASQGDVVRAHWENVYKIRQAYGFAKINGWMAKLFPYVRCERTGSYNVRNPLLELDADDWSHPPEPDSAFFGGTGITTNIVPMGLACAPFTIISPTGQRRAMQFLGGFVGVKQNPVNFSVSPRLGWAVRHNPADDSVTSMVHGGEQIIPGLPSDQLVEVIHKVQSSMTGFGDCIPQEILDFYRRCNGIRFANGTDSGFLPATLLSVVQASTSAWVSKCSWLQFFDNRDGTFCAVALRGTSRVCIIDQSGAARQVAASFSEFVQLVLKHRGCPPPTPPPFV